MAKRPSLFIIAALWAGIVAASFADTHLEVVIAGLVFASVALAVVQASTIRKAVLILAFVLLGLLRSPDSRWNGLEIPPDTAHARGAPAILDLEAPPLTGEFTRNMTAVVSRVRVGSACLEGKRVVVRGLEALEAPVGRRFRVAGTYQVPGRRLNPCGLDYLAYSLRQGIAGTVYVERVLGTPEADIVSRVASLRRRLRRCISDAVPGETGGMLEALLVGERLELSSRLEAQMIKAGTYHVIAISGLHVGIVVVVLTSFLSFARLPRTVLRMVSVFAVLFYVATTGAWPSAQRAGALFLVVSAVRLLQWKVDYANAVCATGVVLLLLFPYFAWDIGFQLSLASVLGITLLVPQLLPPRKPTSLGWRWLSRQVSLAFGASFAAQVFTLPIVLYAFGRTSLIGPVSNLVAIPLTTIAIAAGIEASFAFLAFNRLATVFIKGAGLVLNVCIATTDWLIRLSDPLIYTGRPCLVKLLVYSGALAYLSLARSPLGRTAKMLCLVVLYVFLVAPWPGRPSGCLEVTFLHVGDGDASLIETPDGQVVLVDAGPITEDLDAGERYIVPLLALKGIGRIDQVVITHGHNDHYGGLPTLLDHVDVGSVLVATVQGDEQYSGMIDLLEREGLEPVVVSEGDTWRLGGVAFEVLHSGSSRRVPRASAMTASAGNPGSLARARGAGHDVVASSTRANPSLPDDANRTSIVLRATYGNASLLFTGDVTPEVQRSLAASGADLLCDVVKAPHHGARDSVDPSFLGRLGAKFAVIPAGSRFGSHPHPATVATLRGAGLDVFTTSRDGAVSVVTDGQSITVSSSLGRRIHVVEGPAYRAPLRTTAPSNP